MSFACPGITHCAVCGSTLKEDRSCEWCEFNEKMDNMEFEKQKMLHCNEGVTKR